MSEFNYRFGDVLRAKRSEQGLTKGQLYVLRDKTLTTAWGRTIAVWKLELYRCLPSEDATFVVASPLDILRCAPAKYQR